MRHRLTASTLLALTLATAASGQPPAGQFQPPPPAPKKAEPKASNPVDRTDAAIAAALAHDPDVRMAQAKIQLAEAELAKARQSTTLKVLTLRARIQQGQADVRATAERLNVTDAQGRAGLMPQTEVFAVREKLESVKAALEAAETELKLLTGGPHDPKAARTALEQFLLTTPDVPLDAAAAAWLHKMAHGRQPDAVKGPVPDRLRAALDKPVKLSSKGEAVSLTKALEVFKKEAGLDVAVRPMPSPELVVRSEGEELPVGAWFQLFADMGGRQSDGLVFYVREYGLLVANRQTAPPDAPTLTEFWKQRPPAPKSEALPPLGSPRPLTAPPPVPKTDLPPLQLPTNPSGVEVAPPAPKGNLPPLQLPK